MDRRQIANRQCFLDCPRDRNRATIAQPSMLTFMNTSGAGKGGDERKAHEYARVLPAMYIFVRPKGCFSLYPEGSALDHGLLPRATYSRIRFAWNTTDRLQVPTREGGYNALEERSFEEIPESRIRTTGVSQSAGLVRRPQYPYITPSMNTAKPHH